MSIMFYERLSKDWNLSCVLLLMTIVANNLLALFHTVVNG